MQAQKAKKTECEFAVSRVIRLTGCRRTIYTANRTARAELLLRGGAFESRCRLRSGSVDCRHAKAIALVQGWPSLHLYTVWKLLHRGAGRRVGDRCRNQADRRASRPLRRGDATAAHAGSGRTYVSYRTQKRRLYVFRPQNASMLRLSGAPRPVPHVAILEFKSRKSRRLGNDAAIVSRSRTRPVRAA